MKALIISDKQEIIDSLTSYLKECNYDIIVYRWLLKALDNIEEIYPDLIFLSASEYPRHWKTLASFVQSGIGGNSVKLYLYDPEPLSKEEMEKAKSLGIEAFVDSLSINELSKILPNTQPQITAPKTKYELILTHPETGRFIFGKAVLIDDDVFECCINYTEKFFERDEKIRFISLISSTESLAFEGIIKETDKDNNKVIIKVKNYYEEEI